MSGALKVFVHHLLVYRRAWKGSLFMSFVEPVLYLASIGVGLGTLIARGPLHTVGGLPYASFVAPGMLAAAAMMTASSESMYPITARAYWMRIYDAMLASPLAVGNLVSGELLWLTFRLAVVSGVFFVVMVAFGTVHSAAAPLAIPVAMLSGLALGLPIMAFAATQHTDVGFQVIYRFIVTPLFVLGGTFFPIDRLPQVLQAVAWVTPLANGVAVIRGLTTGTATMWPTLVHLAVLVAYATAGFVIANLTFRRELAL
jgi:lipooligosaccharide transport system permease protein